MKYTLKTHLFGVVGFALACAFGSGLAIMMRGFNLPQSQVNFQESPFPVTVAGPTLKQAGAGVTLRISPQAGAAKAGEWLSLGAVIRNEGADAVLLVQPGDGSRFGWRTPVIAWSITRVGVRSAGQLTSDGAAGCGNINGLRAEDIVRLEPNQEMELNDYSQLYTPAEAGRYRVRLTFTNSSTLPWKGIGNHDPVALAKVRDSTDCQLVSNEITLNVVKGP